MTIIKYLWLSVVALFLKRQEKKGADPPDTFYCDACGEGPWHNSWSHYVGMNICPNCSGAD